MAELKHIWNETPVEEFEYPPLARGMIYKEETVAWLNRLREALIERGWTQGALENGTGEVCLMGGVNRAGCSNMMSIALTQLLQEITGSSVVAWNDATGRTFAEVLDLVDTAILRVKEELAGDGRPGS